MTRYESVSQAVRDDLRETILDGMWIESGAVAV